ncbi:hypothetical protein BDW59DRAFT_160161 [Aspergillus cavernicola]|uniref:Bacteriocin-protection, YdeI or OmpD-associated-domain-containing protein n=1 Tax=Aspergillus cavernicola TaxID=176166 RepID=A0ABR4IIF1_9EURO
MPPKSSSTPKPTPKPPPTDLPIHTFPTASSLTTFLEKSHTTLPGFHLKLAKKSSGIASVSAPEAVEVALCFGWIDGRANAFDENYWLVRYTPRRAKSLWSAKNVKTVARLVEEGRMRRAGLEAVETAKEDGRWERAYDGPAGIEVPGDLGEMLSLEGNERAKVFFEGLNRTDRYLVLHRLQTAAVSRREGRVRDAVEMLGRGEIEKGAGKASGKAYKVEKKVEETTEGKRRKFKVEKAKVVKVSKRVEGETSSGSGRQLRSRKPRQ